MSFSPITILRFISLAEGVSFLVLLYFAIYHKRVLGQEDAIAVPGMAHGVLFLLFCLALGYVWIEKKWKFGKVLFAFVCSLVPFAPFYLERRLKEEQEAAKQT